MRVSPAVLRAKSVPSLRRQWVSWTFHPDGCDCTYSWFGRSAEDLQWLDYLLQLWHSIKDAQHIIRRLVCCIKKVMWLFVRFVIIYVKMSQKSWLINLCMKALEFVKQVMPQYQNKIKLYKDSVPSLIVFRLKAKLRPHFSVKWSCRPVVLLWLIQRKRSYQSILTLPVQPAVAISKILL